MKVVNKSIKDGNAVPVKVVPEPSNPTIPVQYRFSVSYSRSGTPSVMLCVRFVTVFAMLFLVTVLFLFSLLG